MTNEPAQLPFDIRYLDIHSCIRHSSFAIPWDGAVTIGQFEILTDDFQQLVGRGLLECLLSEALADFCESLLLLASGISVFE